MKSFLFLAMFISVFSGLQASGSQICSYYSGKSDPDIQKIEKSISATSNDNLDSDAIVICDADKSVACYAMFTSTHKKIEIISAGCLTMNASSANSIGATCANENCTALSSHLVGESDSDRNKSRIGFCCCSTRLCNQIITKPIVRKAVPVPVYELETKPTVRESKDRMGYVIVILAIASLLVIAAILLFLTMRHLHRKVFTPFCPCSTRESRGVVDGFQCEEHRVVMELGTIGDGTYIDKDGTSKIAPSQSSSRNVVDNSNLKLMKLIGQGRYGTVWHALMRDSEQEVAVKLYKSEHKLYFNNELNIYQVPLMQHPNIVSFIAGSWRLNEECGVNEYMLVMDYIPNGSLACFLAHNHFTFAPMVQLALSAARGLAYLHSEITQAGARKPAIVHRDFNSRNILVKRDGTCAVSDLGFAQKVSGADLYGYTTSLIPDVGTLRYMPPEVLEGSVDLNKCESALKQIDVYALALVLWEISSRCDELYRGYPTVRSPEFKLPFEEELGKSLKFDEMRDLVSVQQRRPVFPSGWAREWSGVKCIVDTVVESWDQDSEARLTAACVVSRLNTLPVLWSEAAETFHDVHDSPADVVTANQSSTLPMSPSDAEHNFSGDQSSLAIEVSMNELHAIELPEPQDLSSIA